MGRLEEKITELITDLPADFEYYNSTSLSALVRGFRENEKLAAADDIRNGRQVVEHRTLVVDTFLKSVISKLDRHLPSGRKYIFAAIGGYGRQELCTNSDLDPIMIIDRFDDDMKKLVEAYQDLMNTRIIKTVPGFVGESAGTFDIEQLRQIPFLAESDPLYITPEMERSLFELRPIHGSDDLAKQVRKTISSAPRWFDTVTALRKDLAERRQNFPQSPSDLGLFEIKYGKGGLRDMHMAVWLLGYQMSLSSEEVFRSLPQKLTNAYDLLLKARAWTNSQYNAIDQRNSALDKWHKMEHSHFESWQKQFGTEGLRELIAARKAVFNYSEAMLIEKLYQGIGHPHGFTLHTSGLRIGKTNGDSGSKFYEVIRLSKVRRIPLIHDQNLMDAGSKAQDDKGFIEALGANGKGSDAFNTMALAGVPNRILPGYDRLETESVEPDHIRFPISRADRGAQRQACLDTLDDMMIEFSDKLAGDHAFRPERIKYMVKEYEKFDSTPDYKVAVELAFRLKRAPRVLNISGDEYLTKLFEALPSLSTSSKNALKLLFSKGDMLFKTAVERKGSDAARKQLRSEIEGFASQGGSPDKAQYDGLCLALLMYTYGDMEFNSDRVSAPIQEKVIQTYRRLVDDEKIGKLQFHGIEDRVAAIIETGLPSELTNGQFDQAVIHEFASKINRWGARRKPDVKYEINGEICKIRLLGRDYPGLFWRCAAVMLKHNMNIEIADIYSTNAPYRFAIDFFNATMGERTQPEEFKAEFQRVIGGRTDVEGIQTPESILSAKPIESPRIEREDGHYKLSFVVKEDACGILYAVSRTLCEKVEADISGIHTYPLKTHGKASDFIFFRSKRDLGYVRRKMYPILTQSAN